MKTQMYKHRIEMYKHIIGSTLDIFIHDLHLYIIGSSLDIFIHVLCVYIYSNGENNSEILLYCTTLPISFFDI